MSELSNIEWCDSTFNPWVGCTPIAPACDFCYAERWAKRSGMVQWGNHPRRRTSAALWRQPLKWQAEASAWFALHFRRRRVFCASLADVFDNQVPPEWRADLWALIRATPDLDWLLLTKRPMNIAGMKPAYWDDLRDRIWLGTTVEDQEHADRNIPHLLGHDSAVRFISVEPMLGPIDLQLHRVDGLAVDSLCHDCGDRHEGRCEDTLDWVIAGGESGPHARPSDSRWFRSLRDQCAVAGVPFLFKQWGEWKAAPEIIDARGPGFHRFDDGCWVQRTGKRAAGRLLDGVQHDGFPEKAVPA